MCLYSTCVSIQVYPELARSYRVKQVRQEIGKDIDLEQVPAPFHGVYRHFKPAVVTALRREVLLALRTIVLLLCYHAQQFYFDRTLMCDQNVAM